MTVGWELRSARRSVKDEMKENDEPRGESDETAEVGSVGKEGTDPSPPVAEVS